MSNASPNCLRLQAYLPVAMRLLRRVRCRMRAYDCRGLLAMTDHHTDEREHLHLIALPNCMHYLARLIGSLPLLEHFDDVSMISSIEMSEHPTPQSQWEGGSLIINEYADLWHVRVTWRRKPLPEDKQLIETLWQAIIPDDWYWQVGHEYPTDA